MATPEEIQAQLDALTSRDTGNAALQSYNRLAALRNARGPRPVGRIEGFNYDQAVAEQERQFRAAEASRAANQQDRIAQLRNDLEVAQNRQSMLDLTQGRAQDILDDSYMADALAALSGAARGENLPFSDEAIGLMQGRYGDMVASQQQAQQDRFRDQMAASGLSPTDPAAQAQMRAMDEQGAMARSGNYRDLLIQQAQQNYAAQQAAANQLMGARSQQYALGNPLAQQAAGYYAQTYDEPRTRVTQQYTQPVYGMPQHTGIQTPTQAQQQTQQTQQQGSRQPAYRNYRTTPRYGNPRQPAQSPQSPRPSVSVGGAGAPGGGPRGPVQEVPSTQPQQQPQPSLPPSPQQGAQQPQQQPSLPPSMQQGAQWLGNTFMNWLR